MAHSLKFLLSTEAAEMRINRLDGVLSFENNNKFVVHVEVSAILDDEARFLEFDAPTEADAMKIGKRWLSHHGATTFAVRLIRNNGLLSKPFGIYDDFELGLVENYI